MVEVTIPLIAAVIAGPIAGLLVGATGEDPSPLLGGIAAIITALGTFVLGLLALIVRKKPDDEDEEGWKAVAMQLMAERQALQQQPPAPPAQPADPTEELPDASP